MRKINYNEKGITLIALVITIIILLILAGVTLNGALSANGLFARAKYAGEKYKESEADESEKLGDVEKEIDKIVDPTTGESGEETIPPVDDEPINIDIKKEIVDKQEKYKVGDTIHYKITVTNQGEKNITNVKIPDQLIIGRNNYTINSSANRMKLNSKENVESEGTNWKIKEIGAGASETIEYDVEVKDIDIGEYVRNKIYGDNVLGEPKPVLTSKDKLETVTDNPIVLDNENKVVVGLDAVYLGEGWLVGDGKFYVALYDDESLTNRVSDINELWFHESSFQYTVFTGLEAEKEYYVGVTTEDGTVLNLTGGETVNGDMYGVSFDDGNVATIPQEGGNAVIRGALEFTSIPSGY